MKGWSSRELESEIRLSYCGRVELIQMRWSSNFAKWKQEVAAGSISANDDTVEKTAREEASADVKAVEAGDDSKGESE